uniref:PE-PGRS family protein PE_PGRS26-like n=1 Tax=Myodes glareolus TaxID=447135 RepID=UPI00202063B0|nr:PE-PGRS family protein PE_PGRS26-like [Myodes glareolus]
MSPGEKLVLRLRRLEICNTGFGGSGVNGTGRAAELGAAGGTRTSDRGGAGRWVWGVPGWCKEGPGARPGPGPGCWRTRAEGIRRTQRRRPSPGHPGSPGGCSSRRGRWAGGGVGAPHLGRSGGLGSRHLQLCALLTLPPPPPPAAGMWPLRGS